MALSTVIAEGKLDLAVARKLCRITGQRTNSIPFKDAKGQGNFWPEARSINSAVTKMDPVFGLADLETQPCANHAFSKHLGGVPNKYFCIRLAVPMLESWLIGDQIGLRTFFKIPKRIGIPQFPEKVKATKITLLEILSKVPDRDLAEALAIYEHGKKRWMPGPEYNSKMADFIGRQWNPKRAALACPSLHRAIIALRRI